MEDKQEETKILSIYEKLSNIQNELKVPKGQKNTFGNYKYRSCEDILEEVKPICKKNKTSLILSDELKQIGERYYICANAQLFDLESEDYVGSTAYAREEETKKGMDGSQITGTASSYARKYALNGLFNIDDTKDADTDEYQKQTKKEKKSPYDFQDKQLEGSLNKEPIQQGDLQVIADMCEKGYGKLLNILKKYNVTNLKDLSWADGIAIRKILEATKKTMDKEKEEVFK